VQAVAAAFTVSTGQSDDDPVQVSALSHSFAAERHTVVDGEKPCVQPPVKGSHASVVHTLLSLQFEVTVSVYWQTFLPEIVG
jgi:hypothetical protein